MGTWGAGAFENDAAADWAFALKDGEGPEYVLEAIERVAQFADERSRAIRVQFTPGEVRVFSSSRFGF